MKVLAIDFELVMQSMRDVSRDANDYYLDKNTGKVMALSRSLIRALAQETRDELDALPEWDAQMIPVARAIVLSGTSDYIRIPEAFGRPEQKWMSEFCATVDPPKLRQRLLVALRGRGSCVRFKEILKEHPAEMRRWMAFRLGRWYEKIQLWLEKSGILAVNGHVVKPYASAK